MRGFPLVNGIVILCCLVAFAVPLATLTGDRTGGAQNQVAPAAEAATAIPTRFQLKFAHRPSRARLSHLGREIWSTEAFAGNETSARVSLEIPTEGIDVLLEVEWPEGTPLTAVQLDLEPDGLETRSAVAWGSPRLEAVLTFVWEGET